MQTFYIKTDDIKTRVVSEINKLPLSGYIVEIKPEKKSITCRQRNYWHALLSILADYQGLPISDLKQQLKIRWLPLREAEYDGNTYYIVPSSESITRDEYNMLIDNTQKVFEMLGVSYPSPEHYGIDLPH